jgi:serine/threonine protein kinase/Tfp pilus assembly protein PilF
LNKPEDKYPLDQDSNVVEKQAVRSMGSPNLGEGFAPSSPVGTATLFAPGSVLAGRFKIVRFIGRGGMGEVYEARDAELGEHVALKTLLPHIASDEHALERFRREVLIARKVTHSNVCRINDVFRHSLTLGASQDSAGVLFLTMELLPGKTLSDFLRQTSSQPQTASAADAKRRLSPPEALPLVKQMAAALSAAHQAGVVHRDFKPGNVILIPKPGEEPPRVVVTDFGLARFLAGEEGQVASFSNLGTPLYMAPEQVEGGTITVATDIYAFGVVLYEMMTGLWPFMGDTAQATARKRLTETPAAPKSRAPDLDPRWNSVILRCLERNPADRFASIQEVIDALMGEAAALLRKTTRQRRRRQRILATAISFVLLATALYTGYPRLKSFTRRAFGTSVADVKSVAIVRLENGMKNPDKDWIATSLEESLRQQLIPGTKLQVIPGADVARMLQEVRPPRGEQFNDETVDKIRDDLGSDMVVSGTYLSSGTQGGGQLQVTLHLEDAAKHVMLPPIVETGREDDLYGLSDRLGRSLRKSLGAEDLSSMDRDELRSFAPSTTAAARAYAEGLAKLRNVDPQGAVRSLQDAIRLDPDAPLPHADLAEAWSTLGYDEKAAAESRAAQEHAGKLARIDLLAIQCKALEFARTAWDDAIRACKSVWDLSKDVNQGIRLAQVQFAAERWNDALATLATIRGALKSPARDDPRLDLTEAQVRDATTDFRAEADAAKRAADQADQRGATLFRAQALFWLCDALQNQDQSQEALRNCAQADSLYFGIGDKIGQARTATQTAHILSKSDKPEDLQQSKQEYEQALKLANEVGSMRDRCDALLNYGDALLSRNDTSGAKQKYLESLDVARQSGSLLCEAHATENLALVAQQSYNFSETKAKLDHAAQLFKKLNASADQAQVASNLGDLFWTQGNPREARVKLEEAVQRRRELGLKDLEALSATRLGDVLLAQDQIDRAIEQFSRAIAIQTALNEESFAVETKLHLAAALIEKGQAFAAEKSARELLDWISSTSKSRELDHDLEGLARETLIGAVVTQEKSGELAEQARLLHQILPSLSDEAGKISAGIAIARAQAASGRPADAVTSLPTLALQAKSKGLLNLQLEAQLAQAEISLSRQDRTAEAQLKRIEEQSRASGFLLIARKAAEKRRND